MPEGSTTPMTTIRATTRPVASTSNLDALRKKYDDLAKQTTEADRLQQTDFARLKAEKQKAFTEWNTANTAAEHAKRDASKGKSTGIDPGSPIVAR